MTLLAAPATADVVLEMPDDGFLLRVDRYVRDVEAGVQFVSALRAEEAAQVKREAERFSPPPRYESAGSVGDCANPIIPESVAQRESGCRWDAESPASFCGGRGCTGFYQLDRGHFYAVSPWNPNVPGSCYGLDPSVPADQTECASRLGPGAWG